MPDFHSLDNGTSILLDDDSPLSAAATTILRDNAAALHENRPVQAGWQAVYGHPWPWFGISPTAFGPFWIYVAEPVRTITVSIWYDEIRTESVTLYATCGGPTPGDIDPPPLDVSTWGDFAAGYEDGVDAVEGGFDIVASTGGRRGWIAVYVWVQSTILGTVEDYGDIQGPGPNLLAADVVGVNVTWPERAELAVFVGYAGTAKIPSGEGNDGAHLWCYYDETTTGGGELFALRGFTGSTFGFTGLSNTWSTYPIGAIDVVSVHLRADPGDYAGPARGMAAGDEPARFHLPMGVAAGVESVVARRVPTLLSSPGVVHVDLALEPLPWVVFEPGDLTTSWQTFARGVFAPAAPADSNGYEAIGQAYARNGGGRLACLVRLAAYSPLGSLLASGPEVRWVLDSPSGQFTGGGSSPLLGTALSIATQGTLIKHGWSGRGKLWGLDTGTMAPTADIRALSFSPPVVLEETDITYPCELRMEFRLTDTSHGNGAGIAVVVGQGLRSRGLDEELPT